MAECKFLHSTDTFSRRLSLGYDFSHESIHFPLSEKGIEIMNAGDNPKTLHQVVLQLSYAFAEKPLNSFAESGFPQAMVVLRLTEDRKPFNDFLSFLEEVIQKDKAIIEVIDGGRVILGLLELFSK